VLLRPKRSAILYTGFKVSSVDETINALADYPAAVISPPRDSEWGRRAILADPDGHRIELLQANRV